MKRVSGKKEEEKGSRRGVLIDLVPSAPINIAPFTVSPFSN